MAIAEIAIFRGEIDRDIVVPELERLLNDEALRPVAEDALEDVRGFGAIVNPEQE